MHMYFCFLYVNGKAKNVVLLFLAYAVRNAIIR